MLQAPPLLHALSARVVFGPKQHGDTIRLVEGWGNGRRQRSSRIARPCRVRRGSAMERDRRAGSDGPDDVNEVEESPLSRYYHVSNIAARKPVPPAKGDHPSGAAHHITSAKERNLAVANVGGDGVIYLRPSDKLPPYSTCPPSFGLPPSSFVLPPSPPMSNSDVESQTDAPAYWHDGLHESAAAAYANAPGRRVDMPSIHTPSAASTPTLSNLDIFRKQRRPEYDQKHLRPELPRPRSTPMLNQTESPLLLQVSIPSHRIGVPRFSNRGTVFFHDSLVSIPSVSDDNRTSNVSHLELDDVFPAPPGLDSGSPFLNISQLARQQSSSPPKFTNGVDPNIYDPFMHDANSPKYIRYRPDGHIFAATPARLIAEITHAEFLDYDLLSDFFLTYRSFLDPKDLLRHLVSRLRWAVFLKEETGRIVRVRTFVAIRHWVLNYFMDDFEPNCDLRILFCDLVNSLARDLYSRADKGGGDLQVVAELKKCWRRTCDIIWGTALGAESHLPTDDVRPGGKSPRENETHGTEAKDASPGVHFNLFNRPAFPEMQKGQSLAIPVDLTSMVTSPTTPWLYRQSSFDVTSCSVPMWRTLGRSLPSFRPRAIMPIQDLKYHASDISRLPTRIHRHKKSKSSKGSTGSATLEPAKSTDLIPFDPRNDLGFFKSGHLIRGMLVAPALPQVTKHVRVPTNDSSDDTSIEKEGTLSHVVEQVRRKLSTRDGSPSKRRDRSGSAASAFSDRVGRRADSPANFTLLSRSDLLAKRVADSYEKLVREDLHDEPASHDELQRPSTRHGYKPSEASQSNLNKDLPEQPNRQPHRRHSHMTTSSRSIMIINDTRNNNLVMNFDVHDMVTPADSHAWQSPPRMFSMPFNFGARSETGSALQRLQPHQQMQSRQSQKLSDRVQQSMASSMARSEAPSQGLGLFLPEDESPLTIPSMTGAYRQSSTIDPFGTMGSPGNKQLRRRPGGDLRAADNVDELSNGRRRNSTGSIAVRRGSATTSATMSTEYGDVQYASRLTHPRMQQASLQLLSTHSSNPNFRASFQVEVDKLAELSGADIDDGGVENTLAKLEGRISSPTSPEATFEIMAAPRQPANSVISEEPEDFSHTDAPVTHASEPEALTPRAEIQSASLVPISRYSVYAQDNRPLSRRDIVQDEYVIRGDAGPPSDIASIAGRWSYILAPSPRNSAVPSKKNWPLGSIQDVRSPTSQGHNERTSSTANSSFLLDDKESLSGDEDETADRKEDDTEGNCSFFIDDVEEDRTAAPLRIGFAPPLSPPPSTPLPAIPFSPPPLYDPIPAKAAERLRTPGPPEIPQQGMPPPKMTHASKDMQPGITAAPARSTRPSKVLQPAHTPFILSFSSEVLATQFTVIERDALEEIDWKELADLRWSKTSYPVQNWADYMRVPKQTGVDIVIARFNLVVKWAVSEIVLTENIHDRARTITKLIHMATHARRLRNYATAYQLTVALLSTAVSRLSKTWDLVYPPEKESLISLEQLVQPIRNFASLRQEMEAALPGACIPFIGLYTHDLAYIAQKPAFVDASGNAVPIPQFTATSPTTAMVNFERFQCAAAAVKNTLRLLEASSKYTIRPNRELVARCLWLAALEDSEIETRSRALEM
ncbi:hypothetical protein ANO11243_003820 [Dothideomycetidae sp. 11243]|nr:hypothetical protein ANO11243_003820 [fungal sp. No.11243]